MIYISEFFEINIIVTNKYKITDKLTHMNSLKLVILLGLNLNYLFNYGFISIGILFNLMIQNRFSVGNSENYD